MPLRFASDKIPQHAEQIEEIFAYRGAYPRFKDFLRKKDLLQTWYDYEKEATITALREWAQFEKIELTD